MPMKLIGTTQTIHAGIVVPTSKAATTAALRRSWGPFGSSNVGFASKVSTGCRTELVDAAGPSPGRSGEGGTRGIVSTPTSRGEEDPLLLSLGAAGPRARPRTDEAEVRGRPGTARAGCWWERRTPEATATESFGVPRPPNGSGVPSPSESSFCPPLGEAPADPKGASSRDARHTPAHQSPHVAVLFGAR
jgi:hypothetical protein